MTIRKSDGQQRFEDILRADDREWVPVEELMQRGMTFVPPGKALRRYQNFRASPSIIGKVAVPKPLPNEDSQIRTGARSIVNDWYRSAGLYPHLQFKEEDGVKYVRYRKNEMIVEKVVEEAIPFVLPFPRNLTQGTVTLPSKRSLRRLCLNPSPNQQMTG